MKITLRKASAVQLVINEFLNGSVLSTTVSVGRYDDPSVVIGEATAKFSAVLAQKSVLLNVLYSLRKKVATKSHEAGIPDILADIAFLEKYANLLKPLSQVSKFLPSVEVVAQQQADLKAEAQNTARYGSRDSFEVSLIQSGWVENYTSDLSKLRKQKQNLSDRLLELNVRNEIELDENEEKVLKLYDLI